MEEYTRQVAQQPTEDTFKVLLANQGKETRNGEGTPPGLTRKERKRDREKKRRIEINKAFDHLLDILFRIDPAFKNNSEQKAKRVREKDEHPLMNRAEIITHAATTLERLNNENLERKTAILQLTKGLQASGNDGPPPPALVPTAASRVPNGAAIEPPTTASFLSMQTIEIQELRRRQQQMEMDAIVASSVAASPSHPNGPPKLRLKHSMGLGLPHQSASLTGQPHAHGESNPVAGPSNRQFNPNDLIHGASDPRHERLEEYQRNHQAYMHRLLLELEEVQAASALLGVAPSRYSAGMPESLLPMPGDSIREEMMQEQRIAQVVAAAHSQGEVPPESILDAPASKRLRNAY